MNKLEYFRLLELQCRALISCIELHRVGVEPADSVLIRIEWLKKNLEIRK